MADIGQLLASNPDLAAPKGAVDTSAPPATSPTTAPPSSTIGDLLASNPDLAAPKEAQVKQEAPAEVSKIAPSTTTPSEQTPPVEEKPPADEPADVPEPVLKNDVLEPHAQPTQVAPVQPAQGQNALPSPYPPGYLHPALDPEKLQAQQHFIDSMVGAYNHDIKLGPGIIAGDVAKGAGALVPQLADLGNVPGKMIDQGLHNAFGYNPPQIPSALQGYQQLTGKPQTQLAYPLGTTAASLLLPGPTAGALKGAMYGAATSVGQGELQNFAQNGQFDPGKALTEGAIGAATGGVLGYGANLASNAIEKFQQAGAVKAAQEAAAKEAQAAQEAAAHQQYLAGIEQQSKANFPESTPSPPSAPPPAQPEPMSYEEWRELIGLKPRKKPIAFSTQESVKGEVLPKPGQSVREQASGKEIRGSIRDATPEEQVLLSPMAEAKVKHDQAVSDFRTAYRNLANTLENPSAAYGPKAQVATPEMLAKVREIAMQHAGLASLKEVDTVEPHFMQHGDTYKPKPYQVKSTHPLALATEVKHLAQKANKLEKAATELRDKYRAQLERFPLQETISIKHGDTSVIFHNRAQKKFEVPEGTPDNVAKAYTSKRAELNAADQAAMHLSNPQFEERITQLQAAVSQTNPEAAKILSQRKPIIDDPRIMEMADKQGLGEALHSLIAQFIEEEKGSSPLIGANLADLVTSLPHTLAEFGENYKGWKSITKGAVNAAAHLAFNKFNQNIIEDYADPVFTAQLQNLLGARMWAMAKRGKDAVPHHDPEWYGLKTPEQIAANTTLSSIQKAVLTELRQVEKQGAKLIDDYVEHLEKQGPSNTLWGRGRLIRTLKAERQKNWGGGPSGMNEFDALVGWLAQNTNQMVQAGNTKLHLAHVVETNTAGASLAPVEFAKGMAAAGTKEGRELAATFHFKAPQRDILDEETHLINQTPILGHIARGQKAVGDLIPEKVKSLATGQYLEEAKLAVMANTAVEVAAKEMNYPGGGDALRKAFINKTLSPREGLEACTHINNFMFRSIKAGPAGYTHMSPVARLALKIPAAKLFLGFTGAHITQSNYFTHLAEHGIKALIDGEYGKASRMFGSLLGAQAIAIAWGGSSGLLKEPAELMRKYGDVETADKLDEIAERAAFIGNAPKMFGMEGFRSVLTQPDAVWYADANNNMIGSAASSLKRAVSPTASDESKHQAMIEATQQLGIGNLFQTISLANMHRIYSTYRRGADTGYIVQHTYSPGKLWGMAQEEQHIGVVAQEAHSDPNAPPEIQKIQRGIDAVLRTQGLPRESVVQAQKQQIDNWEAEERIKSMSSAVHDVLNRQANKLHKTSKKMGIQASAARKLDPNTAERYSVKEAVAQNREDAMPYKEGTRGTFWITQLKLIQKDQKYFDALKAQGMAKYRHEMLTGSYR